MKKKLTRMLAVVLVAMMLIPTAVFAANAADDPSEVAKTLVNMYDTNTELSNAVPNATLYGGATTAAGHRGSAPIDVNPGDTVYFGPCDPNQQWLLALYTKKEGTQTAMRKTPKDLTKVATFDDGSVIFSYKIPDGVCAFAYAHKKANFDHPTLITINQAYGIGDYFAYADLKGWVLDSDLRVVVYEDKPADYVGFYNYYQRTGERNPLIRQHQNSTYIVSGHIPVTEGDVLTIGGIPMNESKDVVITCKENYSEIKTYKLTDYPCMLTLQEDIGYGYGIYSFVVPEGVSYVKINVHQGIYNDNAMMVTKNESFNGAQMRETLDIPELNEEAKAHPFYGKKTLFIGDSISYGSYDTPPSYRNPSASWARRLTQTTGLIPTNVSYPGASVGQTGISYVKWLYTLFTPEKANTYDMVVMHGGVNDGRQGVPVGEALSSDTSRAALTKSERLSTFAGGLQLLFHDVRDKWPEADLYYIANFKLVPDSFKNQATGEYIPMEEYMEQAKILCAEYGIHYIDLFENEELYEVFDYTSKDVLPDLIHPIESSYDLFFPILLDLMSEAAKEDLNEVPEVPGQTETPEENTPNDGDTTPDTNQQTPQKGLGIGAIIGIAAAGVVVAAGIAVTVFFVLKKKKK